MTATAAMISTLRRYVNEPTEDTYTDEDLAALIEQYPLTDERGVDPYYLDTSTDPPTQVATAGWYPNYDLHAAAAQIYAEKAGTAVAELDMPHEGVRYRYSQQYDQYMRQARFHAARSSARSAVLIAAPSPNRRGSTYVLNQAEDI